MFAVAVNLEVAGVVGLVGFLVDLLQTGYTGTGQRSSQLPSSYLRGEGSGKYSDADFLVRFRTITRSLVEFVFITFKHSQERSD